MKAQRMACRVAILFFIFSALACMSTVYSLHRYLVGSSWYTVTGSSPVFLSIPDGNCSCAVQNLSMPETIFLDTATLPTLSCSCSDNSSTTKGPSFLHHGGNASSSSMKMIQFQCPVCPAVEERVEVEKECPPSQAEACPPSVSTVEVVKPCPGVPWYAEGKAWHSPTKFPLCTMDACFDFSRCDNMEEPLVYTYDLPSPPIQSFVRFNKTKYWTDDAAKACLFFVFLDTQYPWPVWPKDLPHWNGGLNHVLITFADKWENRNPPSDSIGNASIMGTIVYQTTSRPGFDIGFPLPGRAHMTKLQSVPPLQRKYFATFRGTRYLGEGRDGAFRSYDSFRGMHNGADVVVATSCNQITNNGLRSEHPELGANCDEDEKIHKKYTFGDLMNTTFGLVPGGRQPASYRFIEVISAGGIPVLITDNYVKPFETLILWHECTLEFPTSQMHRIIPALRALSADDILKRQQNCLRIYNDFLKDDDTLTEAAMRALKKRFMGVIPSFAQL